MNKIFTFTSPPDRTDEAVLLLSAIKGVMVFSHKVNATNVVPNEEGENVIIQGTELSGTCAEEELKEIIGVLSKARIAGYSRETMILFRDIVLPKVSDTIQ